MQNIINYLAKKGFEIESYSEGEVNNLTKHEVDYNLDILYLEDNIKTSLCFSPYVALSKGTSSKEDLLSLFNDINSFYNNRNTPMKHRIILSSKITGEVLLMPMSMHTTSILVDTQEKKNLNKMYLQEFLELSNFLINK